MPLAFWDDSEAGWTGQDYQRNPHDTIFIGTMQAPGLVSVNITRSRRVSSQQASGRDGVTQIVKGMEPAKVDVTIVIWTSGQYRLLETFTHALFPPEGKDSRNDNGTTTAGTKKQLAYDIRHPEADRMGIRSVIPLSITSLTPGSGGERSMTISFEGHHTPPRGQNTMRKIEGSRGAGDKKLAPPLDAAKQASFDDDAIMSSAEDPGV